MGTENSSIEWLGEMGGVGKEEMVLNTMFRKLFESPSIVCKSSVKDQKGRFILREVKLLPLILDPWDQNLVNPVAK